MCKGLGVSKPRLIPPSLQLPFQLGPRGDNSGHQRGDCDGGVGAAGVGATWTQVQVWKPSHRNTWARLGGALCEGRWEAGKSPGIKHLLLQDTCASPTPRLFQAPFHTLLWKPQKMSQQWERSQNANESEGESVRFPTGNSWHI